MSETEKNFGQRNGERVRNFGLVAAIIAVPFAPELIVPALLVAGGGEVARRVSK
ncbi:MAG: hypothetical protein HY426_04085 [Candidatus Levybacteria bacterium]|nr:hypothetical protein [Candidatus Levybacteria bacterium]